MTPTEALALYLEKHHLDRPIVLVEDPLALLELPGRLPGRRDPLVVVPARGNVDFRLRYEPLRETSTRLLVVRQRADVYLPDVERRAADEGAHVHATPRFLLREATGEEHWPEWVDQEEDLVREHFDSVTRVYRSWRRQDSGPLTSSVAERLLLRALMGIDIGQRVDVADAWQAFFGSERELRRLHRRGSRVARALQAWLASQRPPVGWLVLDDPTAAVRLTWLVALLQPYLPDLTEALPRLYPGAQPLRGGDATAVARVAYRLERLAPELAAAQRDAAEAVIEGPLRAAVVRLLRLTEPTAAADLLRRERRSGHLLLYALRTLLSAAAADTPLASVTGDLDLDPLIASSACSHAPAVRAHARLLRSLLRLERVRRRLIAAGAPSDPVDRVRRALTLFVDGELSFADADLAAARDALLDNALAETCWDPLVVADRHKAVVTALYHQVCAAEECLLTHERDVAEAVVAMDCEAGLPLVTTAWDEHLTPLLESEGGPRRTVFLVAGLPWAAAREMVTGPLGARYDARLQVLLAPLPPASEWSLRRALAGTRWRPECARLDWYQLLAACRGELALRRARRLPRALEPLVSDGLVRFAATSRQLCVIGIDLMAGHLGGVPVAEHQRRLDALATALTAYAGSGRRDERVIVMGTSGGVRCSEGPGLAVAEAAYGARCVVSDAARAVPGAVAVEAAALGLSAPGAAAWLATGRHRLAPAVAGSVIADGGLSLHELAVPLMLLTPLPRGEASEVVVSDLVVADELASGVPAEAVVYVTLVGGALAELAVLESELPGTEPQTATLDLGQRRRLAIRFTPTLEPPAERGELTIEVTCRVGPRRFRRRATAVVVAAATSEDGAHESGPRGEAGNHAD